MADEQVTDSGTENAEVTEQSEEQQPQSQEGQDNFEARLTAFEKNAQAFEDFRKRYDEAQKELKRLETLNQQTEAKYRGLQREVTPKLQDYARLRQQNAEISSVRQEMGELRATLDVLANSLVDESQREHLSLARERAKLEAQQRAMQQTQPQPSYQDPEEYRRQVFQYYAGDSEVDINHPEIDWGDGAQTPQEAIKRFTSSIRKIEKATSTQRTQGTPQEQNDPVVVLAAQIEELKAALADRNKAVERATSEAKEEARREEEQRNRVRGTDRSGIATPEGSRQLQNQIEEQLDESLLYQGPAGVAEYNKRMEALRDKVRERAFVRFQ